MSKCKFMLGFVVALALAVRMLFAGAVLDTPIEYHEPTVIEQTSTWEDVTVTWDDVTETYEKGEWSEGYDLSKLSPEAREELYWNSLSNGW